MLVKKIISKADIRNDMEKQIADFLKKGGEVSAIERGISGRENPNGPLNSDHGAFQQPKQGRTYVPEVVAAIDARRKKKPEKPKTRVRKPRKKIIYDDFGEPLREVWVDE